MAHQAPHNQKGNFMEFGGGQTGDLFRSIDWSVHSLGPTQQWPLALKITLNSLFNSKHPMFVFWGPELIQFYNDAYLPSIQIGKHPTAMGQRAKDCWQETWPVIKPQIDLVMNEGGSTWHENQFLPIYRNGHLEDAYWTYSYSPIIDEFEKVCGALVVVSETTQTVLNAKKLEAAKERIEIEAKRVEQEKSKFEASFQAVNDGIFIFNSQGNPVFMNDAAGKVFGSKTAEDVTERFEYFFERLDLYEMDGTFVPLSEWPIAKALRGENFKDWQLKAHRKDINKHWIWSSSGALAKQAGTDITLGVVVLRDITAQKEAENDLKKAKLDAESASHAKSAFLANMSHEIRTPLGAILGFTELMRDSTSSAERSEFAEIIHRNGKSLTKIIDDILDLSKVEAGRIELERISFSVKELTQELIDLFADSAHKKGLSLTFEMHPETPELVKSDPTRIRQILINLIGNAIKFTANGSVKIKVESIWRNEQILQLHFLISDTGVGLSKEQTEKLFEPFSQADQSTTRKYGGSGLGLALSKRLAMALGGDVWMESTALGQGSTFAAAVGASMADNFSILNSHSQTATSKNNLQGFKILVVEDSPDNQELIDFHLRKSGAFVAIAGNGQEGVEKALAENFDLILMDMQMPVLDGYAATEKLRKKGYRKPIVALTAHAMSEERTRTQQAGCDAHLTKPLDFNLLNQTIQKLAGPL